MNIVDDQLPLSFRSTSKSSARQDKSLYHTQGWDSPWKFFRRVGLSIEPSRHSEDQFETELLKTEYYASSALDVSSIVDRLG